MAASIVFGNLRLVPKIPPPCKTPFSQRREREFLYLHEVDALIAATQKTRSPVRNQTISLLLFCQALQPIELCWLRWCDLNFAEKTLIVVRNRQQPTRYSSQITVNLQSLSQPEIDILQQLQEQRTTDWLFASERKQRLSERTLHHIIQHAEASASLPLTVHPYMLRRSGGYTTVLLCYWNLLVYPYANVVCSGIGTAPVFLSLPKTNRSITRLEPPKN